jgi:UDP:flavonoid glycosyltransferase YjiC (YdhE family)
MKFGLNQIEDIRFALKGERTFLWDFPEFLPIQKTPGTTHIGPIDFHHWPYDPVDLDSILESKYPIAVISFGTCVTNNATILRIVKILIDLGYKVIIAAGGQQEMLNINLADPRVVILKYAPLHQIFPHTSLLVTHGGQMTVFEALKTESPF